MHFWIDKRSQQCGFGRSRVAASLSHAGGGLSYGHPPRRSKSSNNSASNMPSSSSNSGSHNQSLASVHRTLPSYGGECQTGASTSRQSSHYTSSNNNAHIGSQQQHQQLLHHGTSNNNNGSSNITTAAASNNNNANATASSAAVLTGSGTIVPLVARGTHYHQHSTRYQPRPQQQQQLQQQLQQQQQHYSYSYHHPQFGNMAVPVRQHDTPQQQQLQQPHQQHYQQHSGVYADDAYSAYHHHSSNLRGNARYCTGSIVNNTAAPTPRRHNSSSNMRLATATAAASSATTTTATVSATATAIPPTQTQTLAQGTQQQQQQRYPAAIPTMMHHTDHELMPSHLKCGMCASLVLAAVFVAGAKFYFDHQGTGLEVLIFCAFSATFFLAACMVSLCRIPKGLLPSSRNGRAICQGRGVNAGGNASCMLELNDVRYLDDRQTVEVSAATAAAAAAGPPPYHIAILLPEQTPATLAKQLPLDESPPPSYDKILV